MAKTGNYRGMEGKLGKKQKAAVDGLIALLEDVAKWKEGEGNNQRVNVHGKYTKVVNADGSGKPFGLWRIGEIDFAFGPPGQPGSGGSAVQASVPENMGLIKACEEYLEEFHTEPYRPQGWSSDIDEKADAEWRVRETWKAGEKGDDDAEAAAGAGQEA